MGSVVPAGGCLGACLRPGTLGSGGGGTCAPRIDGPEILGGYHIGPDACIR